MPEIPTQRLGQDTPVFITNASFYWEKTGVAIDEVSRAFSIANRGCSTPIFVPSRMTVKKLYCYNGATVSGNISLGLYEWTKFAGGWTPGFATRIVTSGAVAQAGTSQWQIVDIADIILEPGFYLLAISCDNITSTFVMLSNQPASVIERAANLGVSSAHPLADTTFFSRGTTFRYPLLALGGIA